MREHPPDHRRRDRVRFQPVRPVAVPALDGQVQVRVPPGTQPGTVLRVDGKGLPRYPGHGRGSLNVTVIVDIPRQLSPWQRLLYEQLWAEDADTKGEVGQDAHRSGGRLRDWLHGGKHERIKNES